MSQCPNCKASVDADAKFCKYCAANLSKSQQSVLIYNSGPTAPAKACSKCGASLKEDNKYCPNCAAPVFSILSDNIRYDSSPSNRKPLIIGGLVTILLVAVVVTAIFFLASGRPTKEQAIQTLRDFVNAHDRGDYEKVLSYVRNDDTEKEYRQAIRTGSTPRKAGISMRDIDAFAEKGKWDKLSDFIDSQRSKIPNILPDFPQKYARRFNVLAENCYALWGDDWAKGIAFYWDGKDLKLIASVDPHDKADSDFGR